MSLEKDDWRLHGQEQELKGKVWTWKKYKKPRESWDHDHCSFCWAKLMEPGTPGVLDEGYSTQEDHYWVCKTCFKDFKEMFSWTVEPARKD